MPAPLTTTPAEGALLFTLAGERYHLVRKLDTSAGAQRLLARRESPRGQGGLVVVKRLPAHARWAQRRRLAHEAWVARRLHHPGLVRVLHTETGARRPLIIMQHIDGVRLERALTWAARRGEHLSAPCAAFIAATLADALVHAHGLTDEWGRPLRLVHRDVSPSNILLSTRGEVLLTDLGAVLTGTSRRPRTAAHTLKGSVTYAAPEVLRLERPDARADLFSLGLVLVEMLTGRHLLDPPHQGAPVPLRGIFRKLLGKIFTEQDTWEDPARLAALAARLRPEHVAQVAHQAPAPLRAVAQRALRVNLAERYATAEQMRDELRAYLASAHPGYGPEHLLAEMRALRAIPRGGHPPVESSKQPLPSAFGRVPPAPR
ncbi:MAG TPA: serine/threonine-protein kinase [Myxococcaceae bacterium]|jgi:serine/threonine-protein kinase